MTNSQAVLLGKGVDAEGNVISVTGQRFYKPNATGAADSIEAVLGAGLLRVPTYLQGEGRVAAVQAAQAEGDVKLALKDPIWNNWGDSHAERLTLKDKRGILGKKQQLYVAFLQNAAMFSNDHQRIRDAVNNRELVNGALQLTQDEVDAFLEAVKDGDSTKIFSDNGWVTGGSEVNIFGVYNGLFDSTGYNRFCDASDAEDFLKNMPAYVVVQTAEKARQVLSGRYAISQQRTNQHLIVDFGGRNRLGKVMDAAEALGYTEFGSYHDDFTTENGGRVVLLFNRYLGVGGDYDSLNGNGASLGVAPEALVSRAKIVGHVPPKPRDLETTVAN